jgi:hypothetical protein
MSNKIKVLFLATNQMRLVYMRLDEELRLIRDKIKMSPLGGSFDLLWQPGLRISDLGQLLLEDSPHIIYFSGHGTASEGLILEDDSETRKPMSVEHLTSVLRTLKGNTRMVFINMCYSKPFVEVISREIDYVIGMDGELDDDSAATFAASFYQMLAFGRSVSEAFQVAKGLAGSPAPMLMVRDGVDASEPFLLQKEYIERLKSSIKRLIEGAGSEEDCAVIRHSLDERNVVLEELGDDETGERQGRKAINTLFQNRRLHFRLNQHDYKKVVAQIFPLPSGIAPPFTLLPFVGREDAIKDVILLLGKRSKNTGSSNITLVRGWPGVGKTTLVGRISRDPDVRNMFPQGVLWTSLEQKPNVLSEMARWGQVLGSDDVLRAPTINEAITRLADLLRYRQMLLIVDDVWDMAHAAPFIQIVGEQCALLVTTRLTSVAEALTSHEQSVYVLPVLTEDYAIKLLSILVPSVVEQNQDACRELVLDLECLPLALHVAGRLLRSEAKFGWGVSELIQEIRQKATLISKPAPIDRIEGGKIPTVSALLMKSTDMLDEFTRDCFAYLGAFAPKPATFDLAAMQAVWEVEDAKPIVRRLVGHGLLEPVDSGRFQMHRILVDHAKSLCSE